jgi:hypothetical protein
MATNEFKAFATAGGANVLSQEEYLALAALSTGFQSGIAKSAEINKALRQATTGVAALTQFISEATDSDINDNGDVSALVTKLAAALAARGLSRENPFADIAADGTVNQALANLGLGEAAKMDAPELSDLNGNRGYAIFPAIINGKVSNIIHQWGLTSESNAVGQATATFPIPFPNKCSSFTVTEITNSQPGISGAAAVLSWGVVGTSLTKTSCMVQNSKNAQETAYWYAVGY